MKQRIQGLIAGIAIGAIGAGGIAYASSMTKTIEVTYDNIKVYKDNVLCELKDSNGSVIEPFIYDGTTYLPVRGAASVAGMQVTWDGATKSVYLWDNQVPGGTYLMEVCPPYETENCETYLQQEGRKFKMSGEEYSNGFTLYAYGNGYNNGYAMFNLNSKYSTIQFTIGHVDDTSMEDTNISFFVDGKLVKEMNIEADAMPQTVSIPVSYGLQLKVVAAGENMFSEVGIGNITVQ